MAWLEEDKIREKFNIQSKSYSPQIGSASASASRKIRRWVDTAAFAEADGAVVPTDTEDLRRYETLIDAHAFLTMYYLAISVGSKLSPDGFIKSAQSPGSPAIASITNQYLTPAELARKKQEYYDAAWDIIEPYANVETAETAFVSASLPTAIRVTADW